MTPGHMSYYGDVFCHMHLICHFPTTIFYKCSIETPPATWHHTVDGRNPAPFGMVKTLINNGIIIILGGAGFCPSTVPSSNPTLHWAFASGGGTDFDPCHWFLGRQWRDSGPRHVAEAGRRGAQRWELQQRWGYDDHCKFLFSYTWTTTSGLSWLCITYTYL